MKRLKKLSGEVLSENKWHQYLHDTYEQPDGEVGNYYYMETAGAVMIIPILPDGRVVMTLQYRYLHDKQCKAFPAGGCDEGNMNDAARRELFEETGAVANEFVHLGSFEPSVGCIKDETHVYLAYVEEMREQQLENTEQIEVIVRKAHEIDDMIATNDVWCGQSIAAWMVARNHVAQAISRLEAA